MFTGLVQDTALIRSFLKDTASECWNLWVETRLPIQDWKLGDSIAVNGVCLTVVAKEGQSILFQIGPETLKVSTFGRMTQDPKSMDRVHLETSLRAGDPLGGHWVSGHVDGVATLKSYKAGSEVLTLCFEVASPFRDKIAPFLVQKGSVAVDGVSLTVNEIRDTTTTTEFEVTLIPHTLSLTHFAHLQVGDQVNLEADLMAKHAARYAEYWKK
jgi:riboflavin synthase